MCQCQGDFVARALRLWQRTLFLPHASPISYEHLGTVNKFRNAFLGLVRRRPHKLAGLWGDGYSSHECTLECLDVPVDEEGRSLEGWEQLHVCNRSDDLPDGTILVKKHGEECWGLLPQLGASLDSNVQS